MGLKSNMLHQEITRYPFPLHNTHPMDADRAYVLPFPLLSSTSPSLSLPLPPSLIEFYLFRTNHLYAAGLPKTPTASNPALVRFSVSEEYVVRVEKAVSKKDIQRVSCIKALNIKREEERRGREEDRKRGWVLMNAIRLCIRVRPQQRWSWRARHIRTAISGSCGYTTRTWIHISLIRNTRYYPPFTCPLPSLPPFYHSPPSPKVTHGYVGSCFSTGKIPSVYWAFLLQCTRYYHKAVGHSARKICRFVLFYIYIYILYFVLHIFLFFCFFLFLFLFILF